MDELQEAVTQMRADYKANPVEPDVWNVLRALNDRHDCSRCGRCCTDQTIGMTGPEIVIAARYLNVPCSGFKKMFIERQVQRWHILKKLDGACPFLYGDDGKTECLIYAVRLDCLATWNHIPEDAEGRKAVKRRSTGEFRGGEMMQHSTMKIYAAFVAGFILGGLAVVL